MIHSRDSFAEFLRLHRLMLTHLSIATTLAWALALYAGLRAPWVNDIIFIIDPASGRSMATGPYLFTLPLILLIALCVVYFGRESLYRLRLLRNQTLEFALAGAIFFTLFVMSVDRTAHALRIGWV